MIFGRTLLVRTSLFRATGRSGPAVSRAERAVSRKFGSDKEIRVIYQPKGSFTPNVPHADQLGVERGRVSRIADRSAVETATGHRTTVGDSHSSKGLEP